MGQIKVLQTNKLYYPVTGGIERVVQQLAEGLSDKTDTTVWCAKKKESSTREHKWGAGDSMQNVVLYFFAADFFVLCVVFQERSTKK